MALITCPECRNKVSDQASVCIKCGFPIKEKLNNAPTDGKCLFTIERKKALGGALNKINVNINGEMVKKLSNGETFSMTLKNGNHTLYCDGPSLNRTLSEKFIGNSNEIRYVVSFPSAMSIFDGEPVQNIILTKLMETEPGTYKG